MGRRVLGFQLYLLLGFGLETGRVLGLELGGRGFAALGLVLEGLVFPEICFGFEMGLGLVNEMGLGLEIEMGLGLVLEMGLGFRFEMG